MYKSTLLQLILIVIGLFTAVSGVQYLVNNFISIIVWKSGYVMETALMALLISGAYFLIAFFLVSRSKDWAKYISSLSRLHGDFAISADPGQIINLTLIGLCFYSLIREVPFLINRLYEGFAGKVGGISEQLYRQNDSEENWILHILNVLVPLIIVLSARPIADYFAGRMKEDPIEIKEENQSTDI